MIAAPRTPESNHHMSNALSVNRTSANAMIVPITPQAIVAASHPNVVNRIAAYMDKAVTPHPRYEVGTVYKGWPIWNKSK